MLTAPWNLLRYTYNMGKMKSTPCVELGGINGNCVNLTGWCQR